MTQTPTDHALDMIRAYGPVTTRSLTAYLIDQAPGIDTPTQARDSIREMVNQHAIGWVGTDDDGDSFWDHPRNVEYYRF